MTVEPSIEVPVRIANALAKASKATGTDFKYLLSTAQRESSLNESAKAKTSSATGLFQFIDATWLGLIKEEGGKYGLQDYAAKISKTNTGEYSVADDKDRLEILELRYDPEISALVAGIYAQKNAQFMEEKIGRSPTASEVYIAHFLGPHDAARLIRLTELQPHGDADHYFSSAAEANRGIFYSDGKPRTVAQVYQNLVSKHGEAQNMVAFEKNKGDGVGQGAEEVLRIRADGRIDFGQNNARRVQFWQTDRKNANFVPVEKTDGLPGSIGTWNNILGLKTMTEGFANDAGPGPAQSLETYGQRRLLFDDNKEE